MAEERRENHPFKESTEKVLGAAFKVQKALGPGLLESTYEACLAHELKKMGPHVETQVALERKTVDRILDLHHARLYSYLRFTGKQAGRILNFWSWPLEEGGIKRIICN